jgi:asparagine synthase (glutamine-hydrolysing)
LEQIVPYLVVGGILIIDDYYDWKGAKKAVDDFFAEKGGFIFIEGPQLVIKKLNKKGQII